MRNVESLPFRDRLQRIGYLLKHTVTVVGRDADIVIPWVWMIVYADAKAEAKRRKSGMRKLAGLDLLMAYLVS